MFPRLVALGGVARAGKDTFYQALNRVRPGGIRISIGDIIRQDCKQFIKKTLGINISKCNDFEKEIVRPILVGYGIAKRKASKGTYFTQMMENAMAVHSSKETFNPNVNYFIMTDVRFAENAYDEPEWVKDNKGILVHISRIMEYEYGEKDEYGGWKAHRTPIPKFLTPANDTEWANESILKHKADFIVEWENKNDPDMFDTHAKHVLACFDEQIKTSKIFRDRFN